MQIHLVVNLINSDSTGYAQHKSQQIYVRNFVAPPVDGHTDHVGVWRFDERDFCALREAAVRGALHAFVLG